jgi:hypothetical protein
MKIAAERIGAAFTSLPKGIESIISILPTQSKSLLASIIINMDAIEFVNRHQAYLAQLSKIVKPEFHHIIRKLQKNDSHDVVKPEHYFNSEAEASGVVFRLFLRKLKMDLPKNNPKKKTRASQQADQSG